MTDKIQESFSGGTIQCGFGPYLDGQTLTCKGYKELMARGVSMKRVADDALEMRLGEKVALIGMTRRLREKLRSEKKP